MILRSALALALTLAVAAPIWSQASQQSRVQILHNVIAESATARIGMPLGGGGIELSDTGEIDRTKLEKEIKKHGESVAVGRIVKVTAISFDSKAIEVELDGGGKGKVDILKGIDGALGGPSSSSSKKISGSKVTLQFQNKVPADITTERLKELLAPVLDFSASSLAKSDLGHLPAEFREAVIAKEARIGMDSNTVLTALGRPNNRIRERVDGVDRVTWVYNGAGQHVTFVVFEGEIVVGVREY